jgi:hypothetical protein
MIMANRRHQSSGKEPHVVQPRPKRVSFIVAQRAGTAKGGQRVRRSVLRAAEGLHIALPANQTALRGELLVVKHQDVGSRVEV